eukprot:TRINITY_DN2759_c0_g2::TRINITY_DN2759_c0_g2_i1::g.27404::m.27404 TRINITY_DN2759_c0_g2::TRINITY_DN2759_c0_g2_i1::g.27404  ORF type:complete len:1072 (+),score=371.91,sp/O60100/IMB4_SCHPO/26.24/6e-93,HEAT_2/PF13646.1/4.1,HEAT_2/PF13646.1/17,HEAT_2/PF13646.1/17,HEAT_2/PF13646.1/2.5e+02,HEAT_2/PF13646.1/7.9e+02,HEAT_2/PF13646.1/5.2e-06,HEAT_2/PF13646.1/3.1e-08,HEAT_2/PF13646.1/0.42,HEAT_2/PF13646.1/0.33,HEAT_2/PF13646.1/16,HEAT_2/PF13646.1/7.3,HEAT_2/PF13646.1/80,HEAT/PF02985.17/5.1e+02,HEAT/PF02985.
MTMQNLLLGLMTPDNNVINQCQVALQEMSKSPDVLVALLEQVEHAPQDPVRQLAVVLMRPRVRKHWDLLKPEVQMPIKATLLRRIVEETSHPVRIALAGVVATIAKRELPEGKWNELSQFLMNCCRSEHAGHREVGFEILKRLLEKVDDVIRQQSDLLAQLFMSGLQDGDGRVRISALGATSEFLQGLETDEDAHKYSVLLPPLMNALQQGVMDGRQEALSCFEVLEDLTESGAPVMKGHLKEVVMALLAIATTTTLDSKMRRRSIEVLNLLVTKKPKAISKLKVIPNLIPAAFRLMAEVPHAEYDEDDEDGDGEHVAISTAAAELLSAITIHQPSSHIYNPVFMLAEQFAASANVREQRAALVAIASLAEGCHDQCVSSLSRLVPALCQAAQNPERIVREAACFAIGQFSDQLQPEVLEYHEQLLPAIFSALEDPREAIKERAVAALEIFCENLDDSILPYMHGLIGKLVELIHTQTSHHIRVTAVSGIAATISSAGESFLPYRDPVLNVLRPLLQLSGAEDLIVRARAIECVGIMAAAVQRQNFSDELIQEFMGNSLLGFTFDEPELKEYTYGFYNNMTELLGTDFALFLPSIMPHILHTLASKDTIISEALLSAEGLLRGVGTEGGEDGDVDDDDASDDGGNGVISIRTSLLDEIASAVQAVGRIAQYSGDGFMPYLKDTLKALEDLVDYFHEDVRHNVMPSLAQLAMRWRESSPVEAIEYGSNVLVPTYMKVMQEDEDREVVAAVCEAIPDLCKSFGRSIFDLHMQRLVETLLKLFKCETVCQAQEDDVDLDADESDDADHDELLIDSVADCSLGLGKLYGPAFMPAVQYFLPVLLKYTKDSKPPRDRTMGAGTIAELLHSCGDASMTCLDDALNLFLHLLHDPENGVKRNAAFGCGVLAKYVPTKYGTILQSLFPLFGPRGQRDDGMLDNACAAVSRMISAHPAALPLPQVLPVLLEALPLKEDLSEGSTVYPMIIALYQNARDSIAPYTPRVLDIFTQVLAEADEDGVKESSEDNQHLYEIGVVRDITGFVRSLAALAGADITALAASLPEKQQLALHKAMTSTV